MAVARGRRTHTTSCAFSALHSVKLLSLTQTPSFCYTSPVQQLICLCWKGQALLLEHQVPQNLLTQAPEHHPPPLLFSPCLTLNCKLTAGEEIEPMVIPLNVTLPRTEPHTSAAAWAFPLSPGAITASRWAPAGKTILGAELGNLAVFNREQGGAAPQVPTLGCSAHLPSPHHKLAGTPR